LVFGQRTRLKRQKVRHTLKGLNGFISPKISQ
jgi:hypothetical protein